MKKFRILFIVLLVIAFSATISGCYMINGQRMSKLKGTYKLTSYTYTPSYSDKNGYVPATRDYINDEKYKYEDYLVITGESRGYYVHKEANAPAYVKEVTLTYERNAEDSNKIDYVIYNDALTKNQTTGVNKLGVSGKTLNHSTPSIHVGSSHTSGAYARWEKVDRATDLSYVRKQLGELKEYDYESFAARGIYSLDMPMDLSTNMYMESKYQYCYIVMDTAAGVTTADVHYALADAPTEAKKETIVWSHPSGDWSTLTIDGKLWTRDLSSTGYFYEIGGFRYNISRASQNLSEDTLQSLILSRLPEIQQ